MCERDAKYYDLIILRIALEVKILWDRDLFGDGRHRLQSNTLVRSFGGFSTWMHTLLFGRFRSWLLWLCSREPRNVCNYQVSGRVGYFNCTALGSRFEAWVLGWSLLFLQLMSVAYSLKIYLICINKLCSLLGRKSDCVTFKFWQISHKMQHAVSAGVGPDNLRATGQLVKK